jgi:hypothetical protein
MHASYVRREEWLRSLPGRAWRAILRALRRERRRYLVAELPGGERRIIGMFASERDYVLFLAWVSEQSGSTFAAGIEFGKEVAGAVNGRQQADTGDAGTA